MENYYKEFYSSEEVNSRLANGNTFDYSDEDEDDFIIADQNVSYQDSLSSTWVFIRNLISAKLSRFGIFNHTHLIPDTSFSGWLPEFLPVLKIYNFCSSITWINFAKKLKRTFARYVQQITNYVFNILENENYVTECTLDNCKNFNEGK